MGYAHFVPDEIWMVPLIQAVAKSGGEDRLTKADMDLFAELYKGLQENANALVADFAFEPLFYMSERLQQFSERSS